MKEKNICINFLEGRMAYRLRQATLHNELLARAIGLKHLKKIHVIDVTAGLGQDGFLLAQLGCQVTLIERSPVVAASLQDGLQRALADPNFSNLTIRLIQDDAIDYLKQLSLDNYPDVIYLDPMYPRRMKSTLAKKEICLLREIVGEDNDAPELFNMAIQRARHRVVIKRPCYAAALTTLKPHHSIRGSRHRFDVYIKFNNR